MGPLINNPKYTDCTYKFDLLFYHWSAYQCEISAPEHFNDMEPCLTIGHFIILLGT